MPSELDRTFDTMLEKQTGPDGQFQIGEDPQGRAIVTNLPPTLTMLFDIFCSIHGEMEAVVAGEERLSFAALNEAAGRAARALAGCGIAKGDRVAIAMRNAPAWMVAYMAVLKAGGVAVLVNGWWQPAELATALRLAEPKLVLADAARAERVAATGLGLDCLTLDIDRPIAEAMAPLLDRCAAEGELPQVLPDDLATLLFTSGSTGAVKGAVSTHRAVTSAVYVYAMSLATLKAILISEGRPPNERRRTLVSVPLFHVTGEVPVFLNSFVIGRTMVLLPRWDAGEALRLIEKEAITYFIGVPTMSLEMMNHPDRDKYDLSSLTDLAAGGAPRPERHVGRLHDAFRTTQLSLGYGLTETNAPGCANFWQNYLDKPGSTGRAMPLVELAILGPGDRHLDAGETGEIAFRGAFLFEGYWRDPEATAAAMTEDGYFRTGDLGYVDADGYLFIVDRKKDIIIRGGENISCQEVEAALYGHDAVAEAAVFGIADEDYGEVPAAVVYSPSGVSEAELRPFLEQQLARFKLPARIWFTDEPLPKLGTGKIDKRSLRAAYAAES